MSLRRKCNSNVMNQEPDSTSALLMHPVPLPQVPYYVEEPGWALPPPKPYIKITAGRNGELALTWNMDLLYHHAVIASYQIFAYKETDVLKDASLWKKLGDVSALPLPMACTLHQLAHGNKYYITVRAVDVHKRVGPSSEPLGILCERNRDYIEEI